MTDNGGSGDWDCYRTSSWMHRMAASQVPCATSDGCEKRSRRVAWTPALHGRFVDAVSKLGANNCVPKSILRVRFFIGRFLLRSGVPRPMRGRRLVTVKPHRTALLKISLVLSCGAADECRGLDARKRRQPPSEVPPVAVLCGCRTCCRRRGGLATPYHHTGSSKQFSSGNVLHLNTQHVYYASLYV